MKQPKEIIHVGELEVRFILDREDTDNKVLLFESVFPAGAKAGMPPHYHQHVDEVIYVSEGILTVILDGKKIELGAGESCFVPRGTIHHIANNTAERVKGFGMMTPALVGIDYFKEISALLNAKEGPDIKKIQQTMSANDTVLVTPFEQNAEILSAHKM